MSETGLHNSNTGKQIRIRKHIQLPEISYHNRSEIKNDIWGSGRLNISNRQFSEKTTKTKNYFLAVDEVPVLKPPNFSPENQPIKRKGTINEKKLFSMEKDLDQDEIFYLDHIETDLRALESLFYSYSNYLENLSQCISEQSFIYKSYITRAKNGFIHLFRKMIPKLKRINRVQEEKSSQTLMSINPSKHSVILSHLGDLVNNEVQGTDRLEKYIQKTFIESHRKSKINSTSTQTDYKLNSEGIIEYEFKSYESLQNEILLLRKQNSMLIQEKKVFDSKNRELDDFDQLVDRNKILEAMIIEMRNSN